MPSRIWFFCSSIDSGTFPFFHIVGSLIKLQIRVFAIADTLTPMPRYGKKTDMEVFEPTMWEKEARHIWWSGNKFSLLIRCINMHFGPYIYSVSH